MIYRYICTLPVVLLACAGPVQQPIALRLQPLHTNGIYAVGERVGWRLTLAPDSTSPTDPLTYTIKRNNFDVVKAGSLDFVDRSATVEVDADQPEMLYLQVSSNLAVAGAAVAPLKLQPALPKLKDFDAFWKSKLKQLNSIPANPIETPGQGDRPGVEFSTVKMDNINGAHIYGQLAKPNRAGKFPAVLLLQWASPPYPLQKSWVTDLAAEGFLAFNVEPHDVPTDAPQAFYDSLPNAIKRYNSIGWDDRDKSYFVQMYLGDYRATEYLASRPDWDGKTLIVMGTSMGGQQSLCVAGLNPKITHLIVEEPAGCDMNGPLHGRQSGYPNFPSNNIKVMETAQYVDAVNFAGRIRATCLVAMGFIDTVAPPVGIWTAFNQIKGEKEAAPMIDAPHNNTATQKEQLPYSIRAAAWLDALAKGRKVPLRH